MKQVEVEVDEFLTVEELIKDLMEFPPGAQVVLKCGMPGDASYYSFRITNHLFDNYVDPTVKDSKGIVEIEADELCFDIGNQVEYGNVWQKE